MSCIIVDIDGTIALRGERNPYDWDNVINDKANGPIVRLLMQLEDWNDLIFVSGRKDVCMAQTVSWLEKVGFEVNELYMRDSNDNRPDEIVKKEIYQTHIAHRDVVCVFDDRNKVVKMWRELGLACLQVAEGDF